MPFSKDDKIIIQHYHSKGYGRRRILGLWDMGCMEAWMNFNCIHSLEELKVAIVEAWDSISRETLDKLIGGLQEKM